MNGNIKYLIYAGRIKQHIFLRKFIMILFLNEGERKRWNTCQIKIILHTFNDDIP